MALYFTHCIFLSAVPGLHYDEAWAALFSHRIAFERGFWPIQAMSPYTSAWSHTVAAVFFRIFGVSLLSYRVSAISCVLLGVYSLARALNNLLESRSAIIFPWIIAFFPALVVNHRFAIEINTFHVLCLGSLCWALSSKSKYKEIWICCSVFIGITSHILFIAPALALWISDHLSASKAQQRSLPRIVLLTGLLGFFLKIALTIPEHDKSLGLLILISLCLIAALSPAWSFNQMKFLKYRILNLSSRLRHFIAWALMVPSLLLLAFFMEGSWSELFFSSKIHPELAGWFLAPWILILWQGRVIFSDPKMKPLLIWFSLTLVLSLILATKPAPRYFEIPLVMAALLLALAWSRCPKTIQALSLIAWCTLGSVQLDLNYFAPILRHEVRLSNFHFLIFRDSSSDTLPKQEIAHTLGSLGCTLDQIEDSGPRLMEPLKFLALGDWPGSNGACKLGELGKSKITIQPNDAEADGEAYVFVTQLRR